MILSVSKKLLIIILFSLVVVVVILISIYVSDFATTDFDAYKVIETKDGAVRGQLKATNFNGKPYYAFQGIPYAKSPVGELRFKVSDSNRTSFAVITVSIQYIQAPEPIESWAPKTIDAFQYGNACMQISSPKTKYGKSEDCLFLNIFVPVGEQILDPQ